jgi:2',3'-cyclic-nucleotide 2'-phosphodiesterase
VEREIAQAPLGEVADVIVIDCHAEATSEKYAMGHAFDGRVSLVVGTHTHVPTADAHILEHGTAYQTDLGMCGAYDSVIGMDKAISVEKFTTRLRTRRNMAAGGEPSLCGSVVEINAEGLAERIQPVRLGGRLEQSQPEWNTVTTLA